MSQDQLGLFDTPPSRKQVRLSLVIVGVLVAALFLLSALPDIRLGQMGAFIPMVDAIMLFGDLVTATLLYVQATVFRSRALTVLATGYFVNALLLIAHALTFPGAFAPDGLLGAGVNTTAWIAYCWRAGFPVAIILYVLCKRAEPAGQSRTERPPAPVAKGVITAIIMAAALITLTTAEHDLLPSVFSDRSQLVRSNFLMLNAGLITLLMIATLVLFRQRSSVLDMWLLVALAGWLAHALLNLQSVSRFTVGFYSQFSLLLFSNLVVMLALMAESNRLYARLALSVAARDRERDARWKSMEAVAGAISHEVGQPLSAVITNATGARNWLNREHPNHGKAMLALDAIIEAGKRATDVTKSVRAMFARKPGVITEFDLNALALETASLLDRELSDEQVSLRFALDEALPPVLADRVQMQQVLVNLLTNAIESVCAIQRIPRRIAIRSAPLDDRNVLLEVSDTGPGITPAEMDQIFQPFFTTKAAGTGLGLSLCRTIVEEHGGSLWATSDEGRGATFHLQLPQSEAR